MRVSADNGGGSVSIGS